MDKSDAKLQLSAEEMRLVTDPGWILTKNSIIGKVLGLFAGLSEEWRERWEGGPRSEPKISRGENYKGLPWVILDYPRVFGKEDIFAIRTMFWWGHAFSMTLHLRGRYKEVFITAIREHAAELAAAGFQVGRSDEEWRHEHDPAVDQEEIEYSMAQRPFLKLSAIAGLEEVERLGELFRVLTGVLGTAGPAPPADPAG